MSLIDYNTDDIVEAQPLPAGDELMFRVSATRIDEKEGRWVVAELEFPDYPESDSIGHFINIAQENDTPRARNFKKQLLKQFYRAVKLPTNGSAPADHWVGCEGWCIVERVAHPKTGLMEDRVKSFVIRNQAQ